MCTRTWSLVGTVIVMQTVAQNAVEISALPVAILFLWVGIIFGDIADTGAIHLSWHCLQEKGIFKMGSIVHVLYQ